MCCNSKERNALVNANSEKNKGLALVALNSRLEHPSGISDAKKHELRSIFKDYWKADQSRSQRASPNVSGSSEIPSFLFCTNHAQVSNANAKENVASSSSCTVHQSLTTQRRSIFGGKCTSQPLLPSMITSSVHHYNVRKTQSTSVLERRRKASCLLQPRFSGLKRREGNIKSHQNGVSFDTKVQVALYTKPIEKWASQGWSKYFDQ